MTNKGKYLKYVLIYFIYIIFLTFIVKYLSTNYANYFIAFLKSLHIRKEFLLLFLLIIQYFLFLLPLLIWCFTGVFGNCREYFGSKLRWLGFKKLFIYVIGGYFITIFILGIIKSIILFLSTHYGIYIPFFSGKEQVADLVSNLAKKSEFYKYLMFFVVTIVGPFVEEIIYRAFITEFLLKRRNSILSVALASLIFAVVHFEWGVLGYLFILGFYLGYIWYKTRSLIYTFLAHFLVNFITFMVLIFYNFN